MNPNLKISVIVTIFNDEEYILRCMESIIHQSYKNLEIIVVNDNSTDSSKKYCEKYENKDKRILFIDKKRNTGVSSSRNMGLKKITGDYVTFVDGDDWLDFYYIEQSVKFLEQYNLDVLMTPYKREYEGKTKKNKLFNEREALFFGDNFKNNVYRRFFGPLEIDGLKNAATVNDFVSVWGKFYKKNCVEKIEFKNVTSEDCLFNIESLIDVKRAMYYGNIYYHYNKQNKNSIVSVGYHRDFFSKLKKFYDITEKMIDSAGLPVDYRIALNNKKVLDSFGTLHKLYLSKYSIREKRSEGKLIMADEIFEIGFKTFDMNGLSFKWILFYHFVKKNSFYGTFILAIAADFLKKYLK